MIECKSLENKFKTLFTNGKHEAFSDASKKSGGGESGFRSHELVEAAYANCLAIWLRMYADRHEVPLERVSTQVSLNRTDPSKAIFEYKIDLEGPLTRNQRIKLMQIAKTCPVGNTLSSKIIFRNLEEEGSVD